MLKHLLQFLYPTDHGIAPFTVLTVLAVLAVIGLAIYHVIWMKQPFNATDFGEGIAWPLGGHGVAAWGQSQQDKAGGP